MKKMQIGFFSVLPATIIFGHAAFAKSGKPKVSAEKDAVIKSEVETAISMLQTIHSRHQKGEMTLEQAKQLGADLLQGLHYGEGGYFWADTTEGVNVVLYGRKDVEGKNRLEFKDYKGKFMLKEFIATAKAGGGYADYWFPKKNETTPVPKRGYVQLFKPFGWVVGTGYYL